ncbi:hypothetical protein INP51_09010 [Blautia liquoris]|uniref:Uncharacterized protein n=2 Tax=Blautia liquoris TaxID=2779518 RepID=A0A7M2RCZ4_9FIRM|nr:hypothetical protein INP51_09010 [Blautia liquoris]
MVNFLFVLSGVCWTLVYISLIYRGFKDKTYGMPLFALGLNIAWEVLYSIDGIFIHKANMPPVQNVANVVWAFFDILIVITFFRYGKKYFPEIGKKYFLPFGTLAIFTCVALQLAFYLHFDSGVEASQYSAFAQNAAMSIMFLYMLFQRKGTEGQSFTVAIAKCLGTLAPTILGGFIESTNMYIMLTGMVCLVFDIFYIIGLFQKNKTSKVAVF